MRRTGLLAGLGLALAATVVPAAAQSPPPPAGAATAPPADDAAIWTFQDENASLTTSDRLADRLYANGLRLGWTSREGGAPAFLARLGQTLWGEGRQRIGFDLTEQIYTPTDTETYYPPLNDRPYAGVLLGTVSLIHDSAAARSVLALGLGVVGPAALGQSGQNGFHSLIGQDPNNGWETQLHNEPLIEITSQRTWRLPIGAIGALETDALPELTAGLGNLRIYGQTGVTFRLGQGLDSDFGVARLLPGLTGTDVFVPTRPVAWYVFIGADAQAVAYDVTLNGNTWQSSRSVSLTPGVAEFQGGFAIIAGGARLSYTQVVQTQEYQHQKGGPHQFGSLALSLRF